MELLATELFPIITSFDRSVQQVRNSISGVQNVHLGKGKKIGKKKIWKRVSPISYLEVEDDCPNEAEGELGVAVHDVLPSDVDQLDLLVPDVQKG